MSDLIGNVARAKLTMFTDFRGRCIEKLEKLGDTAVDSQNYHEAVKRYSDALSLNPQNLSDILYKRSRAQSLVGSWQDSLLDADKARVLFELPLKQS